MILTSDFPENFKDSYILVKTGLGFSSLTLCITQVGGGGGGSNLLHSKYEFNMLFA